MRFKKLGNTDVAIPVIGQGTIGAGSKAIATEKGIRKRIDVLQYGIDLGMTLLDTADDYEGGHSEELAGRAIQGNRDKVFLCTKFQPRNNSFAGVTKSIDRSLKRLKTDYVDLYQIHWPNPRIPVQETLEALARLVGQGKIRFVGVCNFGVDEIMQAEEYLGEGSIVSVQSEFNAFNRGIEHDLLPYCIENTKTVVAYNLFNQGQFRVDNRMGYVSELALKYDASEHQILISWAISRPNMVAVISTMSIKHCLENAKAAEVQLLTEEIRSLDNVLYRDPIMVDTDDIQVINYDLDDSHGIYTSLEEALENALRMEPSPADLAKDIVKGKMLKPVELVSAPESEERKYYLLHGRTRYWAWVIAFEGKKSIPALISQNRTIK